MLPWEDSARDNKDGLLHGDPGNSEKRTLWDDCHKDVISSALHFFQKDDLLIQDRDFNNIIPDYAYSNKSGLF